jgi:hypothetical protein
MNDDEIIRIGRSAEALLGSEALRIALDEIERQKIENWANGVHRTPQEREEAYQMVRAAREFRSAITTMVDRMKISRDKVDRQR